MDSGVKRAVLVWPRRSGKDLACIAYTSKAMFERVGAYYHVYPFYTQGRKAVWDGADKEGVRFRDRFPKELIASVNDQQMKIEFKNGSIWQVVGADMVDSIVGANPVGVVFSEYSLQRPEAWNFLRPILAENGGWAIFNYTPRGMNHGWELIQDARSEPKWFSEVLTIDDTKTISQEALEEEKRQMPQAVFEQEYYCKFLDGATQVFRRIEENTWSGDLPPEEGRHYQLGVDLAKSEDFTVITPFELNEFRVGKQERFNQIDWNLQKAKVEAFTARYNNARVFLDSTGVGDPIFEDLERQGIPVESFKFTEQSRKQLLENLAILLEQDKIKIPDDQGLKDELRSFQWVLTDSGKTKAESQAPHDDRVMSLALAVWKVSEPIGVPARRSRNEEPGIYQQQTFD